MSHRRQYFSFVPEATGVDVLRNPALNKGLAFSKEERKALRIRGLVPACSLDLETQKKRVLLNLRNKTTDLEKYIYLMALQDRNETLFYAVISDNLAEITPLIYTPTVGLACEKYGHIFRKPRGLYISIEDAGEVGEILDNWPERDVRVIVVTDGERILGLGDLGAHGMGIPIGKLNLYVALAGIHPRHCLPVLLDVGTNNEEHLGDCMYTGLQRRRVRGQAYDDLVDEFITAVRSKYGAESFADLTICQNAFVLLEKYRNRICTFNDDIQGTASVTLAGLFSALRVKKEKLRKQTFLFLGAGEAGVGIGSLVVSAILKEAKSDNVKLTVEEARQRLYFIDSKGLVMKTRKDALAPHKLPFAHDISGVPEDADLLEIVNIVKPTAIIGVSAQAGVFNKEVVTKMASLNARPVIFPLSNPTSKAECTAEDAWNWTNGTVLFASGSPFPAIELADGKRFVPGQGNNAYIFPGVGLGVVAVGARHVTDEMFLQAAETLASLVTDEDLNNGCLFPSLDRIRQVSAHIAMEVAKIAVNEGLSAPSFSPPSTEKEFLEFIESHMYEASYSSALPPTNAKL